jgi:acetyltransferase-like isoleucine patch superfamily enzyme
MTARVKFLQDNAKGHRHANGGGFVSENAKVAETAYVGPNAMVLDGATVKDNACIKEFAVVFGPKTIISGNAKIGGRAWVTGDLKVSGNARILEASTVQTTYREPNSRARISEGSGEITGSAVIKGEHFLFLAQAENQTITGGVVLDYTPSVGNSISGVFEHGRFYQHSYRRPPAFNTGVDAGALYANWQFNTPRTVLLEDSYVNNNGTLHGRPGFKADGQHKSIVFNGNGQYAQAPASVADFGELTIDIMVNRSGGKAGRLFDFGTSDEECFYMTIDGAGRPTLTAKHAGKTFTATASQGIPADQWAQLRVEMNGATASVFIDGKQVANKGFAFSPTSVFIGDEPEGNFIACGRKKDEFFKGQIDHFRTYRKIHKDFESLGSAPFALTQGYEWSEQDQQLHDTWEGLKKAKEAGLDAGKYGELQNEIKKIQQQKKDVLYTLGDQGQLDAKVKQADKAKNELEQKIRQEQKAIPGLAATEEEIKELGRKISAVTVQIRQSEEYVKLNEQIKAAEQQRGPINDEIRNSPELKAISAKTAAAGEAKAKVEEKIKQLPELKKLAELAENEKDNKSKRAHQDKYNGLFAARKSVDPEWQKAGIVIKDMKRLRDDTLRRQTDSHAGRKKLESRIQRLRESLKTLNTELLASHGQHSRLQASRSAKQADLNAKRKAIEQRIRSSAAYKNAEEARLAAINAVNEARKRNVEAKSGQAAKLDARIKKLQQEADLVRHGMMRTAGVLGANPYPGRRAAALQKSQQSLNYHTSADWDYGILGDGRQPESELPEKTKKWLMEVRGY